MTGIMGLDAAQAAVQNPATSPSDLMDIAYGYPHLGAFVARHPNAYPDLLDWLALYGADDARDAVAARRAVGATSYDELPSETVLAPAPIPPVSVAVSSFAPAAPVAPQPVASSFAPQPASPVLAPAPTVAPATVFASVAEVPAVPSAIATDTPPPPTAADLASTSAPAATVEQGVTGTWRAGAEVASQSAVSTPVQASAARAIPTTGAPADAPSMGYAVLGFFIPIVGLILYLTWKDQTPLKAKSAGKGALVSVIVGGVFTLIYIIFIASMFSSLSYY